MKHFFVINPHSFKSKDGLSKIISEIKSTIDVLQATSIAPPTKNEWGGKGGGEQTPNSELRTPNSKIYISRHPRDAFAAVRRYLLSIPSTETVRIYAIGGDGILFDCLNGMIKFPNAELTSVPYGNANDFVRSFGEEAAPFFRDLKKLSVSPAQPVDVINCGSNFALNEANVGVVGKTLIIANSILRDTKRKWLGRFTPQIYSLAAIRAIMKSDVVKQSYKVLIDDEDFSGNYADIHIANTATDGGAYVPSPYAKPNDGVLDVVFMKTSSRLEVVSSINDRNKGKFEKRPIFIYKKCKSLSITSDSPLSIQMDGEAFYANEFNINIVPGGVKIFAPEGLSFADYSYRGYKNMSSL